MVTYQIVCMGLKMKIGYFDCFSGASGDMILGALIDAGVSVGDLNATLDQLSLHDVRIEAEETHRNHLRGIKAHVRLPGHAANDGRSGEHEHHHAAAHHAPHGHAAFADIE